MSESYQERRGKGLCGRCGKRPPIEGRALCEECRISANKSAEKHRYTEKYKANRERTQAQRNEYERDRHRKIRDEEERYDIYADRIKKTLGRHDLHKAAKLITDIIPDDVKKKCNVIELLAAIESKLSDWEGSEDDGT